MTSRPKFFNESGTLIPSVDESQMREVDRIAVEDFGLGILQMMENAGRNIAAMVTDFTVPNPIKNITIAAGSGGNGGGGICAARHLFNHGYNVKILLTKSSQNYQGAAGAQLRIVQHSNIPILDPEDAVEAISTADIVIDALIGYSLRGEPIGVTAEYVSLINNLAKNVLALDLPSGIDATSGNNPGKHVKANWTITLALPKPGLSNQASGEIYLGDIGIPPEVYERIGIILPNIFSESYIERLRIST